MSVVGTQDETFSLRLASTFIMVSVTISQSSTILHNVTASTNKIFHIYKANQAPIYELLINNWLIQERQSRLSPLWPADSLKSEFRLRSKGNKTSHIYSSLWFGPPAVKWEWTVCNIHAFFNPAVFMSPSKGMKWNPKTQSHHMDSLLQYGGVCARAKKRDLRESEFSIYLCKNLLLDSPACRLNKGLFLCAECQCIVCAFVCVCVCV